MSDYAYDAPKETVASEQEGPPAQTNTPSAGSGLTPDEYRRRHEITVSVSIKYPDYLFKFKCAVFKIYQTW